MLINSGRFGNVLALAVHHTFDAALSVTALRCKASLGMRQSKQQNTLCQGFRDRAAPNHEELDGREAKEIYHHY